MGKNSPDCCDAAMDGCLMQSMGVGSNEGGLSWTCVQCATCMQKWSVMHGWTRKGWFRGWKGNETEENKMACADYEVAFQEGYAEGYKEGQDAKLKEIYPETMGVSRMGNVSLRDYFAAAVLNGLLATGQDGELLKMAYVMADGMLEARKR